MWAYSLGANHVITSIWIQNWKSFQRAELPLAPLTLMIGANASGKSNAIEGVRCLSWLAEGRRLSEITSAVQEADQLIRGTVENLTHNDKPTFALGCRTDDADWSEYLIEIRVDEDGLRVVDEGITGPASSIPLFNVHAAAGEFSHSIEVQYNNFSRGGKKPRIPATDEQSVLSQLTTPARFGAGHNKAQGIIPAVVERFRGALTGTLFLDPSPRRMRQYSFIVDSHLKGDGANLSSVLYELCERRGQKDQVLDFVRNLPEQDFRDIFFVRTPRNEVMLQLAESFAQHSQTWDAPVLSDGTLRVLAVAAALLSAEEGSLVVIEEIDNGVHPSRAAMLLENIERVANARALRVLLTTHNPALVDTLPPEATPDIVYCYRDPSEGDSRLVRLEDLPNYPELVARGPLGQLMTRGILERMVKQRPSDEKRRKAADEWLSSLAVRVRSA
jgi:predicted ATPase